MGVFRATRHMDPAAQRSTGTRLESAALAAAVESAAGQPAAAAGHLREVALIARVADRLGDLAPAERQAIEAAVAEALQGYGDASTAPS